MTTATSTSTRSLEKRHFQITTPLGDDKVLIISANGSEAMGRLFEFDLDIASESNPIDPATLLGKSVTLAILLLDEDSHRYFNGIINRISLIRVDRAKDARPLFVYRASLVPKLWLTTRHADCRIFQNKTVPDIILDIIRHAGCNVASQLSRTYRSWEYCVQYRETDFNFISRLMENEGIYYYFKHDDGKHTMVLCDGPAAHSAVKGYDKLKFQEPADSTKDAFIWDWTTRQEITPTRYHITDYNFETPSADLKSINTINHSHDPDHYEIFDYPGGYTKSAEGNDYVGARMQEQQAQYIIARGSSSARGIHAGAIFKIDEHPVTKNTEDYLITSASYQFNNDDIAMGLSSPGPVFACQIVAIPNSYTFRPARITPKPVVQGPQTAKVVGPSGEEIYTDKYARIKVSFFWDRQSKNNETSSCWIRVAQPFAGKGWGNQFIPRMGMEVVVTFLEGDPDRPLVTGSVYNNDNMPPNSLPGSKTQSGIKSRSSKGATPDNFNELRLEDKKGSEEMFLHAEKDFNQVVKNNFSLKVGSADGASCPDGSQTLSVWKNRTESVETGNETVTIKKGNRTFTISQGNETFEVSQGTRTLTVNGNDTHEIKTGNRETKVDMGNDTLTISMGNQTTKVSLGQASTEALQSIQLTCGPSSIRIDPTGITINGMMITLNGQMMTSITGQMTTVTGSAMLTLAGGILAIG